MSISGNWYKPLDSSLKGESVFHAAICERCAQPVMERSA
jgi:hypothetical protein